MPHLRKICATLIAVLIAYGIWALSSEWHLVLNSLSELGWHGFAYLCFFSLINYALRFYRWHLLLKQQGHRLAIGKHLLIYLSGFALTTTPGKAGEAIRCFYLKPLNVKYAHSLAALMAERVTDLFAICILALGAIVALPAYRPLGLLLLSALPIAWFILQTELTARLLERLCAKIPFKRLQDLGQHTLSLLNQTRTLIGPKPLSMGLFLGVIAWGAEAYAFAWMAWQLDYEHTLLLLGGIYAFSTLAGALSFIPGGLGSTEMTFFLLLSAISIAQPDIISMTLLCRLATLWLAVIIGILCLTYIAGNAAPMAPHNHAPATGRDLD